MSAVTERRYCSTTLYSKELGEQVPRVPHEILIKVNLHDRNRGAASIAASEQSSRSPDASEARHALGVLFVPGVGDYRPGRTLVTFADYVLRFLESWRAEELVSKHDAPSHVVCSDIALEPGSKAGGAPAHLVLDLSPSSGEGELSTDPETWCIAESSWAAGLHPPSVPNLFRWAVRAAPAIAVIQLTVLFRRRYAALREGIATLPRFIVAAWLLLLAPFICAVLLLFFACLLLFATVPIPRLSHAIRRFGARLAAVLGGSYVLSDSPTQFGALVLHVSEDLKWLEQQCNSVAVVAHSQGALMAHHSLRVGNFPRLRLFVTFGSALGRLEEIRRGIPPLLSLFASFQVISVGYVVAVAALSASVWSLLVLIPNALFNYVLVLVLLVTQREEEETDALRELRLDGLSSAAGSLQWVDFFASADPVPNGPMFESSPEWMASRMVFNQASPWLDHTGYLRSTDGFLVAMIHQVAQVAQGPVAESITAETYGVGAVGRRRGWRLGWLVRFRWVLACAIAVASIRIWSDLLRVAQVLVDVTPQYLRKPVGSTVAVGQGIWDEVGMRADVVVSAVVALGAFVAIYLVVWTAWYGWSRHDVGCLFRRDELDLGGAGAGLFAVMSIVSLSAIILLAFLGSWSRYAELLASTPGGWRLGGGLLLMTYALVHVRALVRTYRSRDDPGRSTDGNGFVEGLGVFAAAAPLVLLLASWVPGGWWEFGGLFLLCPGISALIAFAILRALHVPLSKFRSQLIARSAGLIEPGPVWGRQQPA